MEREEGGGTAENEEGAVNHAGKVEAVERAQDEMDRQVTKERKKSGESTERMAEAVKLVMDFSIFQ